jgi:hypothetical protein
MKPDDISLTERGFSFEKLSSIRSFAGRDRYCRQNLNRIGVGSARAVYELPDGKVLKLAKNAKGIAQNDVEGDYGLNSMYSNILSTLHDVNDDGYWVVADKYEKVSQKELLAHLKVTSEELESLSLAINNYTSGRDMDRLHRFSHHYSSEGDQPNMLIFKMIEMTVNFDMMGGDFTRASSWGRRGDELKIIDYGLTKAVYQNHYERKPESPGYGCLY